MLNLCADIHGDKGCGVVVDNLVDGNHHALHHQALDNLRRGYFQLERKVATVISSGRVISSFWRR